MHLVGDDAENIPQYNVPQSHFSSFSIWSIVISYDHMVYDNDRIYCDVIFVSNSFFD